MAEEMDDVGAGRCVYSHSYRCRTGVSKEAKDDVADNLMLTFWVTLFECEAFPLYPEGADGQRTMCQVHRPSITITLGCLLISGSASQVREDVMAVGVGKG